MSTLFENSKKYNFSVWPSEILGTDFKSIEVEGIVGYSLAKSMGHDIDAWHAQVYPTLPAGTPDRPQDFEYILIRTPMGSNETRRTAIGIPWVKADTIVEVSGVDFNVLIRGGSMDDLDRVREMLTQNNINNFDIQIVNSQSSTAI